ncbi:MAG: hypothetical protein ACRELG_00250 [Gemmataceae bacterium]
MAITKTNTGSNVAPRWSKPAQPSSAAQVARSRQAPAGTHPSVIEPRPLFSPGRLLKG